MKIKDKMKVMVMEYEQNKTAMMTKQDSSFTDLIESC